MVWRTPFLILNSTNAKPVASASLIPVQCDEFRNIRRHTHPGQMPQYKHLCRQLMSFTLASTGHCLMQITDEESGDSSPQLEAMRLPIVERRRLMAQQAEAMAPYYVQTSTDRDDWQAGDFLVDQHGIST
jgi:hypothetical protein